MNSTSEKLLLITPDSKDVALPTPTIETVVIRSMEKRGFMVLSSPPGSAKGYGNTLHSGRECCHKCED